jgi:hypothetical protein
LTVRYHGQVTCGRVVAIVLVTLVGAGQALLDSCVLGCHAYPHASARQEAASRPSAHCHDTAAIPSSTARWRSTSTCDHDHSELSADVVSSPRPGAAPRLSTPALTLTVSAQSDRDGVLSAVDTARDPGNQRRSASSPVPLRV